MTAVHIAVHVTFVCHKTVAVAGLVMTAEKTVVVVVRHMTVEAYTATHSFVAQVVVVVVIHMMFVSEELVHFFHHSIGDYLVAVGNVAGSNRVQMALNPGVHIAAKDDFDTGCSRFVSDHMGSNHTSWAVKTVSDKVAFRNPGRRMADGTDQVDSLSVVAAVEEHRLS